MIIHRIAATRERRKKRVAAYCRVSTMYHEQEESFDMQVRYYTALIASNPDWEPAEIYADQGTTGTEAKKRPAFAKMLQDASHNAFDLLLVKSISRFSRNIVDCQQTVTAFKDRGIEIRFEREGISTLDPTSDLIFALLCAVAQDESRSISDNVKWSYRNRFQQGQYCLGNNRIMGYDTDARTKKLIPNAQAWIIRYAFDRFIAGASYRNIASELNQLGARTMRRHQPLTAATVQRIIRNETYAGDKLLQKHAPINHLTKRPDPTAGFTSWYLENDHPPIIDRETWRMAQARAGCNLPR